MKLKLVLVEPKYQINMGNVARLSKNFGINKLHIVKPRVKITGKQAIMFSKHARELLEHAKIYKNFDSAISDCDVVVGTTGIWRKAKANFSNIFSDEEAVQYVQKLDNGKTKVAIVIGRDDIGLKPEELSKCDIVAYIRANPKYPVLNLSHATGIMLYAFTRSIIQSDDINRPYASKAEEKALVKVFRESIAKKKAIRDKKAVEAVFKRMIKVSQPTKQEIHALITALK